MTRIFCDGCGAEGDHRRDIRSPLSALPIEIRSQSGAAFQFTIRDVQVVWQFNSTGRAFCEVCFVRALKAAVDALAKDKGIAP